MVKNKMQYNYLQTKMSWYSTFKSLTDNLFPLKLLNKATQNQCMDMINVSFPVQFP